MLPISFHLRTSIPTCSRRRQSLADSRRNAVAFVRATSGTDISVTVIYE